MGANKCFTVFLIYFIILPGLPPPGYLMVAPKLGIQYIHIAIIATQFCQHSLNPTKGDSSESTSNKLDYIHQEKAPGLFDVFSLDKYH